MWINWPEKLHEHECGKLCVNIRLGRWRQTEPGMVTNLAVRFEDRICGTWTFFNYDTVEPPCGVHIVSYYMTWRNSLHSVRIQLNYLQVGCPHLYFFCLNMWDLGITFLIMFLLVYNHLKITVLFYRGEQ